MIGPYTVAVKEEDGNIKLLDSYHDKDEAMNHADRVEALKHHQYGSVFVLEINRIYNGNGGKFLDTANENDFYGFRSLYKSIEDYA